MKWVIFLAGWAVAPAVVAAPLVCVRNATVAGFDPCARGLPRHRYVTGIALEPVCVTTYADSYCKDSPQEFDHIRTPGGDLICTVNYYQPPISDQCGSLPDSYLWVPHAWPDG